MFAEITLDENAWQLRNLGDPAAVVFLLSIDREAHGYWNHVTEGVEGLVTGNYTSETRRRQGRLLGGY